MGVSFTWENINFVVKDKVNKTDKSILKSVSGVCQTGELIALMGPSGSGKTSLLNILARRVKPTQVEQKSSIRVNGKELSEREFKAMTAYVEQEDALIGSLTVRETVLFTAELTSPCSKSIARAVNTDTILQSVGLWNAKDTIVGTPIRKGISGGQKRRLSVATQLVTRPTVLFLDEPTSGLDSTASFEVIQSLKKLATERNMIVIASIHQPSTSTFELFDKCMLLAKGQTVYAGPVSGVVSFFDHAGVPCPTHTNPAEHMLEMTSTDFGNVEEATMRLNQLVESWSAYDGRKKLASDIEASKKGPELTLVVDEVSAENIDEVGRCRAALIHALRVKTNLHRNLIKAVRDPLAYTVRLVMYIGLAVLMATTFLTTPSGQEGIQMVLNSLFFSAAFLSFMCVAYIPAFLEDVHVFRRESSNGIGSPTEFLLANMLVGLPFLLMIALVFSLVVYWAVPYRNGGFGMFVLYLFLDLAAGESLVVLFSIAIPIFIVALAATAFANGLWMVVGGFLVPPNLLNTFWKHTFWYINYQRYVFFGLVRNEVAKLDYACQSNGGSCNCMYVTPLLSQCQISGEYLAKDILQFSGSTGLYVGVLFALIAGMRFFAYLILTIRKH